MQSLSKTPLNIETARKIVASNLGSAASLTRFEELTEGFYNAAYLLEIDHRQKIVLKIAPPPAVRVLRYEKNILQAEVEALRLVKQQTQMPVPQVYFHDDSFSLLPSPYFATLTNRPRGEPVASNARAMVRRCRADACAWRPC